MIGALLELDHLPFNTAEFRDTFLKNFNVKPWVSIFRLLSGREKDPKLTCRFFERPFRISTSIEYYYPYRIFRE
jgi:hypothetical protein